MAQGLIMKLHHYEVRWVNTSDEKIVSYNWAEDIAHAEAKAKQEFKDYVGIISVFRIEEPAHFSWLGDDISEVEPDNWLNDLHVHLTAYNDY
jgi:hypothetical protein